MMRAVPAAPLLGPAALLAAGLAVTEPVRLPVLPWIVCAAADPADAARPRSAVTVLRSDALDGLPGKRITTLLVHYVPRALTPKHVHGGPLTGYVISGHVRSQLNADPPGVFGPGGTFFEPVGTVHTFIENPSLDEPADLLATIIHDEGAQLTTLIE